LGLLVEAFKEKAGLQNDYQKAFTMDIFCDGKGKGTQEE